QPKMLLMIEGVALISRVVSAFRRAGVPRVVVVAPPADSEEGPAIACFAAQAGAEIVAPLVRPAEMRHSIDPGLAPLGHPAPPAAASRGARCRGRRSHCRACDQRSPQQKRIGTKLHRRSPLRPKTRAPDRSALGGRIANRLLARGPGGKRAPERRAGTRRR